MNIDDMDGLDEETRKEIEELQKVTREKDGDINFLFTQLEIGITLKEKEYFDYALEVLHKIKRLENLEIYTIARVEIGEILKEKGDFKGALESWQSIERVDDSETYARAQLEVGRVLKDKGEVDNALKAWLKIEKNDSPIFYAIAQHEVSKILEERGKLDEALEALINIEKVDDLVVYLLAQEKIGKILEKKGNIKGALAIWKNIQETDDPAAYVRAQYRVGQVLKNKGDFNKALKILNTINEKSNLPTYAVVQFEIGQILMAMGKIDEALEVWRKMDQTDDSEIRSLVKIRIGQVLKEKGQLDEAIEIWRNINKSEDLVTYSMAQFEIAQVLKAKGDTDKALEIWRNISKTENSRVYIITQLMIGDSLEEKRLTNESLDAWYNIKRSDDLAAYVKAQLKIGRALIYRKQESDIINAKHAFKMASELFPYEAYCYSKICNFLSDITTESFGYNFLDLLDKTLEIVEILKLNFGQGFNEEKSSERKLAHYTNTSTTNILLETNEKTSLPSFFRLNTINNVNDPSEGHLLVNYLKNIRQNSFYAPDFDKNLHAFISCFTFNHDSLNQFRLYGKENDKEASGVSLVFDKEFFQLDNSLGGLSFLSLDNNLQNSDRDLFSLDINEYADIKERADCETRISKQPVMRCVYIDPTSDYIQLAQRNRITFFREFGNETVVINDMEISKAEDEWKKYKHYIDVKTSAFNDAFIILKNTYQSIMKEKLENAIANSELFNSIDLLVNEILLPLKYLIKHSAFQEEQECRMIYVTSFNAPEVNIADKKFLFVEYEASVKENLNKVYIAPAATEYQLYLAWLLRNTNVKIELSNNPYRQT